MPGVTVTEEAKTTATHTEAIPEPRVPAEQPDFTPHARNVIVATLAFGFAFLAICGGWLLYSAHLYQNCDPSTLGLHHFGL